MRDLKAFLLGTVALGVLAYAGATALAVAAQTTGKSLSIGFGPLVIVSVEHRASDAVTTFGLGVIMIAVVGGLVNVAAASLIGRRAGGRREGPEA